MNIKRVYGQLNREWLDDANLRGISLNIRESSYLLRLVKNTINKIEKTLTKAEKRTKGELPWRKKQRHRLK